MSLWPIFLGLLLLVGNSSTVSGASQRASALRQTNGLTVFTPPEKFLADNFVADEMTPAFIFGSVKSFVSSRKYPATWLIEEDAKSTPDKPGSRGQPAKHALYLEEDCPDKVIYYVFIDQNGLAPQQRNEYLCQCHCRSKTEPENDPTNSKLEQACRGGWGGRGRTAFYPKKRGTPEPISGKFLVPGSEICPDLRSQPAEENLAIG